MSMCVYTNVYICIYMHWKHTHNMLLEKLKKKSLQIYLIPVNIPYSDRVIKYNL